MQDKDPPGGGVLMWRVIAIGYSSWISQFQGYFFAATRRMVFIDSSLNLRFS